LLLDGFIVGGLSLFIFLPCLWWCETAGHDGVFKLRFWSGSGLFGGLLFGEFLFLAASELGGWEGVGSVLAEVG